MIEFEKYRNGGSGRLTVLTGAGISTESGIPTFRGPEGYWTIGSVNYHPQQMATYAMFREHPEEVWRWYLYRLRSCRQAKPNPGHLALVKLEKQLGERFCLITQNVDNLHIEAGNDPDRTLQIHGNINSMRCQNDCHRMLYPLPEALLTEAPSSELPPDALNLLVCPDCGLRTRPHVLWFDECYDEIHYKYDTAMAMALKTDLLIITGTSGATSLPYQIASLVQQRGATAIDINIEKNTLTDLALNSKDGEYWQMTSTEGLAKLCLEIVDC